ncbi:MAG: hypothetical protein ACM3VU_00430, partial [Arthrospira platensis]
TGLAGIGTFHGLVDEKATDAPGAGTGSGDGTGTGVGSGGGAGVLLSGATALWCRAARAALLAEALRIGRLP